MIRTLSVKSPATGVDTQKPSYTPWAMTAGAGCDAGCRICLGFALVFVPTRWHFSILGFARVADPRGSMVWSRPGTVSTLQHQDMRRGKMKHTHLFVVVVSLMIVTGTGQAWADGTHGSKIKVGLRGIEWVE